MNDTKPKGPPLERLETVLTMWESDAKVDITEPSREITKIPLLHSKYLNIMTKHRMAVRKCEFDIARMKKRKWEYYNGKLSKEELEEYGWEQFPLRLKADVPVYMDSDSDMIALMEKKAYHEEVTSVCGSIMKELANRTYQLREHMQHERFISGGR